EEGIACFDRFIRCLRRGLVHQALCLRASEAVRELMPVMPDELVCLYDPQPAAPDAALWQHVGQRHTDGLVHDSALAALNQWVVTLLLVQLQRAGMLGEGRRTRAEAWQQAGIVAKYERWWQECLRCLEASGLVQLQDGWITAPPLAEEPEATWRAWEAQRASFLDDPALAASVRVVEACLRQLPEVLRGAVPATDVLFPNGSMECVEGLYKNNPCSDHFNGMVADVVEAYVTQRLAQEPLATVRLIEIGAGTGGTSATLLARLQPYAAHLDY